MSLTPRRHSLLNFKSVEVVSHNPKIKTATHKMCDSNNTVQVSKSKKLTCQVAEQMTLLDSQLFQRIDSAELLTWVQEQVPFDFITSIMIISVTATSFLAMYLVGKTTSLSGGGEEYELDEVHRALQQHVLLDAHHHPPAAGC